MVWAAQDHVRLVICVYELAFFSSWPILLSHMSWKHVSDGGLLYVFIGREPIRIMRVATVFKGLKRMSLVYSCLSARTSCGEGEDTWGRKSTRRHGEKTQTVSRGMLPPGREIRRRVHCAQSRVATYRSLAALEPYTQSIIYSVEGLDVSLCVVLFTCRHCRGPLGHEYSDRDVCWEAYLDGTQ